MNQSKSVRVSSWLFTPATRPDRFEKAIASNADVSIIDLEDSVAPVDKAKAQQVALEYLAQPATVSCGRALRINGLDKGFGVANIHAFLESAAAPDYIVLPKAESAAHLKILDRLLLEAGKQARLVGIIESAQGLSALESIAASTPRLAALMFG